MVNEAWTFGGATVLTVIGLVVMLYGVSLTQGLAFNSTMGVGGAIVAVGIVGITWRVWRLDAAHGTE